MAKLNKWAKIIQNVANRLKGRGRKQNRVDQVPSMDPSTPEVAEQTTAPKKSLGILNKAFANMKKRNQPKVNPAFDIFPEEMQSQYENQEDREVSKEIDGHDTGFETYLHKRRSKSDGKYAPAKETETKFSSPDDEQQIAAPTNMGEYDDLESTGVSYDDPVISTKPTPTSIKMGVPRPGPSTFIQTARYNPQTKRLNVQYTDGTIFPYENVSPELADDILKKRASHSPGQEMLDTIYYGHGTTKADEIYDIEEGM